MNRLPDTCELATWAPKHGFGSCNAGLHKHHILPRSLLTRNKEAKKLVEQTYADILMADVCPEHNSGLNRCADQGGARAYLIEQRVREHGEAVIATILEDVAGTYKSESDRHAITLAGILSRT